MFRLRTPVEGAARHACRPALAFARAPFTARQKVQHAAFSSSRQSKAQLSSPLNLPKWYEKNNDLSSTAKADMPQAAREFASPQAARQQLLRL